MMPRGVGLGNRACFALLVQGSVRAPLGAVVVGGAIAATPEFGLLWLRHALHLPVTVASQQAPCLLPHRPGHMVHWPWCQTVKNDLWCSCPTAAPSSTESMRR